MYIHNANDLARKVKAEWESIKNSEEKNLSTSIQKQMLADTLNKKGDFNKDIRVVEFVTTEDESSYLKTLKRRSSYQNYYFEVKLANPPFDKEKRNSEVLMVLETRYDRLIRDLQRDDVFDGLIVVRDTNIIFNTIDQQLLFKPGTGSVNQDIPSTLSSVPMLHTGRIIGGEVLDISISNIPYKAFVKPLKVNNDTWFAGNQT